jgi:ubiquinone/menaquinone biosynthesis C-methylase UbiE
VGGINFFSDKARAIEEMIRVARPGTKLAIIDETERMIRRASAIPLSGRYFRGKEKLAAVPVDLVPKNMLDIKVDYILNGRMYVLTFVKS